MLRTVLSTPKPQLSFVFKRCYRLRPGMGAMAEQRDERLLKHLEGQMVKAKELLRQQEGKADIMTKLHSRSMTHGEFNPDDEHNVFFWRSGLTADERKLLRHYKIGSMQELYAVYQRAEKTLGAPPFPDPQQLPPDERFVHQLYSNIPARITEVKRGNTQKPKRAFWNSQWRYLNGFV